MPRHTLYFSDRTYAALDIDKGGSEGLSGRVSALCSYAIELLRLAVPALSIDEWCALIEITKGVIQPSEHGPQAVVESFAFGIGASGPECNEKWGINCPALARKYRAMDLGQQLAVTEVCRRFWAKPEVNKNYDNWRDILEAHGAKFSD